MSTEGARSGDSATPNPARAEQPDCRCVDCGGDQPGHDSTCSYMRELTGEQPEGKGAVGEVYALPTGEHRVELGKAYRDLPVGTKVYASAPAAPGAAVGVDECRPMTPYMAKLWLDELLADHDATLPKDTYDAIIAALAGKEGAK